MKDFKSIYFVGAGGIGMSALIRYYLAKGIPVGGYDRTPSELTDALIKEGAKLHFVDNIGLVDKVFLNPEETLIVRTPAVPADHSELLYFKEKGFNIVKRAELLGVITRQTKGICLAGTHGKTTTSSMTAHILHQSNVDCTAFLGGILKNYDSNLILSDKSELTVIEADEYDRSFHHLRPYMAAITSTDPDHLDIYGTEEAYLESFNHFTSLVVEGGVLIVRKDIKLEPRLAKDVRLYSYSGEDGGDFHATNIRIGDGSIIFDFVHPNGIVTDVELGVPVSINIENAVVAMAMGILNGMDEDELRAGIKSYEGAKRRFDFQIKTPELTYIDDYAHHPDEIKASISSVRALYPNRKLTVVFQPHLYSRTQDFAEEFAKSLDLADEIILLDIYPARELPIEGVSSYLIYKHLNKKNIALCSSVCLLEKIKECKFEILLTLGAGDIDRLVEPIKERLQRW